MSKTATAKPKKVIPKESEIQKAAMKRLGEMGIKVYRRNVMAMVGSHNGKTRMVRSGESGMVDLYGWLPNDCARPSVHFEVESKRPGKKPEYNQILWLRKCNECTQSAFWYSDVDSLEAIMKDLMRGGRIVYHNGEKSYANPDKKTNKTIPRVIGPSYEFYVEMP
jgi:hypothetical protein